MQNLHALGFFVLMVSHSDAAFSKRAAPVAIGTQRLVFDHPPHEAHIRAGVILAGLAKEIAIDQISQKVPGPYSLFSKEKVHMRTLNLGPRLLRKVFSTLFEEASNSLGLFKYQVNCDNLNDIHPLVREAVMFGKIAHLGISLKLKFLSGAIKFERPLSIKTDFAMRPDHLERCLAHPRSSVRFVYMERGAETLLEMAKRGGVTLGVALKLTLELLEVLDTLHQQAGIVHGDIHPANVVLDHSGKVKLIDFGKAFFRADFALFNPEIIHAPPTRPHPYETPFTLTGARLGFRDDLFNALHILATLMVGGDSFFQYCNDMTIDELRSFKGGDGYYFAIPNKRDPVMEAGYYLPLEAQVEVKNRLSDAMHYARNQHFVDAESARIPEVALSLSMALEIVNRYSH